MGAFSGFSIGGPVFHLIDDCEHPLLYLSGAGIASYETAIIFLAYAIVSGFGGFIWKDRTELLQNFKFSHTIVATTPRN
jgi:hypothetical protein